MLLNRDGYGRDGRRLYFFDLGSDTPTPVTPDYTPVANASAESAKLMADLGQKQLDQSQSQYDKNMAVAKPVVDAQVANMNQMTAQSADYDAYTKGTFRPIVDSLNKDATDFSTTGAQEQFGRQAASDLEGQQTNEAAQAERAQESIGVNPNSGRFAGLKKTESIINAGNRAGATSNARVQANQMGINKKLTVAGLVSGMPALSVAANGASTGAGTAAVGNTMAPGGALTTGIASGAGITGSGLQMKNQGLQSILQSQGGIYNAGLQAEAASNAGTGQLLGMVGGIAGAAMFS